MSRFCKPLDTELITRLAREHPILITVEEGSIGGFGSHGMPPYFHVCSFMTRYPTTYLYTINLISKCKYLFGMEFESLRQAMQA